jgi:ribosomal protein L14E/L6E/L27E
LKDELQLGQIVRSKSGRDKGRFMVIVGFYKDEYVYIADGILRKSDKPKLKKIKHIAKTNVIPQNIADALNGGDVENTLIIKELKKFNHEITKEDGGKSIE